VSTTTEPAVPATLAPRQILVVFSGLLLAMLLAALDSTIVATALPTIVGELGGLDRLGWVVTAYLLAQTVVTPLYGKLGDLYGRRIVLQVAIGIFLVGSVLCGMSRTMLQLVAFRAVQGLGGGGLMVTTQAVVGDIVPPRDRGRYQGIFGAVFGISSVAGPLLGGYFTTQLSWRWIFYINLPLGILALVVLAVTLPASARRAEHRIDYAGAALLAVTLAAIVILTDLGGGALAWRSTPVLALAAVSVAALVLFLVVERRAAEPVLPLRLFRDRTFAAASAIGFVVGFALFGSVTYLPLFLQVVRGASPTASGMQMLPMMGGMLLTSIVSGQLISRTGRYRIFPIVGTVVMTVGLFLMSRLEADTSRPVALGTIALLGLGLGMVMQVLVLAVQNAVDYRDLGVATSGVTLFRFVGGSLGTAVLGAIFASQLAAQLRALPAGTLPATAGSGTSVDPRTLANLSDAARALYTGAYTHSLAIVFLVATGIALAGCVLAWVLPERPLRRSVAASARDAGSEAGEAFAMPSTDDREGQLERAVAMLGGRDAGRTLVQQVVARSGLDLSPAAAWLLARTARDPNVEPVTLGRTQHVTPVRMREAAAELERRGLVTASGVTARTLTDDGRVVLARLLEARRERLLELFADWDPAQHDELVREIGRVAREIEEEGSAVAESHKASARA
jgi:EmrB/QacA subfamily drug resistance transporter